MVQVLAVQEPDLTARVRATREQLAFHFWQAEDFHIKSDVATRPTRARESGRPPGRGRNVPGGGHRRGRTYREANLRTAAQVPRKAALLLPRSHRSRSPRRPHPRR